MTAMSTSPPPRELVDRPKADSGSAMGRSYGRNDLTRVEANVGHALISGVDGESLNLRPADRGEVHGSTVSAATHPITLEKVRQQPSPQLAR